MPRPRMAWAFNARNGKGFMRILISLFVLMFASGLPVWGQPVDDAERCATASGLEERLHNCSAAIESSQLSNADLATTLYNRGYAYQSSGNYDAAIADYDRAVRLDPAFSLGFYARAVANYEKSNYGQAIRDYDEAIRLNPDFSFAYEGRGYARFLLGQFMAAQANFAKVLELTPGHQDAALWSVLARSRAGQEARSELGKNAAQLQQGGWQGRAISLFLSRATPEEVLSAAQGFDTMPDREQLSRAYFFIAEHDLTLGNTDAARRLFQQATETGVKTSVEYAAAGVELKAFAVQLAANEVAVQRPERAVIQPSTEAVIPVAVLLPLSGPVPAFGATARDAVRLAVDEWNAKGGVLGKKIVPVLIDSGCMPGKAANAVDQSIDQDNVHYLIGGICSKASVPASEIANSKKVIEISIGSTNPALTAKEDGRAKEYVYRACFIDPFQGALAAKFALNELRVKRAFIMVKPADRYVRGQAEGFESDFKKGGGKIVGKGAYVADEKDFSRIIDKIAAIKPDIVYLPDYYDVANLVIKQAREKGVRAIFMGGDGWNSDDLNFQIAEGSFFTSHYSANDTRPEVQSFVEAFSARYKDKEGRPKAPGVLAALAYDATNIMLTAIKTAGVDDTEQVKEVLNRINFNGVTGQITFDANHNPVKSGVIFAVKRDRVVFDMEVNPESPVSPGQLRSAVGGDAR